MIFKYNIKSAWNINSKQRQSHSVICGKIWHLKKEVIWQAIDFDWYIYVEFSICKSLRHVCSQKLIESSIFDAKTQRCKSASNIVSK